MAYLGEEIKKLGFGLMRLPQKDNVIDIEQTKEMVDMFIEAGFTYFDTAWAYPGSEDAIRQALVERYPREKNQLATKNAAWISCKTKEDAIKQFETSLKQTGAGYFDFYLLHNLGEARTKPFDDFDMWGFVQEKKAEGLIKHVGFSFHSTPDELEEILKKHNEVEFVQLQLNYADLEHPAIQARGCYDVARKYMERNIVEVVPLAYMRGRTLEDAFIILDDSLSKLDTRTKLNILENMIALNKGVLMISHDIQVVKACSRVIFIHENHAKMNTHTYFMENSESYRQMLEIKQNTILEEEGEYV